MISEKIMNLWSFLLLLLFFILIIQGLKYIFLKIKVKRERKEMKDRLQSDKIYNIFQKPQLKFDIFYDDVMILRIKNEGTSPIRNINVKIDVLGKKTSMIVDAPLGSTEIPLNIDIPSEEFELSVDFTYIYKFQRYSEKITRYFSITKKETFHEKSLKEIKKEYRRLVKKYHPDLAKNEEERKYFESKLEEINRKYSKLLKKERIMK